MGVGVQPCCCDRWVCLSQKGWLYDINIYNGKLTNPRQTGLTAPTGSDGAVAGAFAMHPKTRKLYGISSASALGAVAYLYRIKMSGEVHQIGAVDVAASVNPPGGLLQGILCQLLRFSPDGTVLYFGSKNGNGQRNAKLMTVDINTGAGTAYSANYDNDPVVDAIGPITANPGGGDFHPSTGVLYCWSNNGSGVRNVAILDTTTGVLSGHTDTGMTGLSGFQFVKKDGGTAWAYGLRNSGGVASVIRCKNIDSGSPTIETVATVTGRVEDELIFNLCHIG